MRKLLYYPALVFAAFWPVGAWYIQRIGDRSDEPWGVLALITLGILLIRNKAEVALRWDLLTALVLLTYVCGCSRLPPLGNALLFALFVASSVVYRGMRFHPGVSALTFLSLPIIPTLQFVFGYPLRAMVSELSATILRTVGMSVVRSGTLLQYGEKLIFVDAPCSGIRMLWVGSYLTAVLLCVFRLSKRSSSVAILLSWTLLFTGNVIRALNLFFLEIFLPNYPEFLHGAVGLAAFGTASLLLFAFIQSRETQPPTFAHSLVSPGVSFFVITLLFMAPIVPLLISRQTLFSPSMEVSSWPTEFRGQPLLEQPLSERENGFLKDFPGDIKRFRAGEREVLIRYVSQATRMLHPSSDCLKGAGYSIKAIAGEKDELGRHWSCNLAIRKNEKLKVCELVSDGQQTWPDASSWYWSAIWRQSRGPWWAYTTSTPVVEF